MRGNDVKIITRECLDYLNLKTLETGIFLFPTKRNCEKGDTLCERGRAHMSQALFAPIVDNITSKPSISMKTLLFAVRHIERRSKWVGKWVGKLVMWKWLVAICNSGARTIVTSYGPDRVWTLNLLREKTTVTLRNGDWKHKASYWDNVSFALRGQAFGVQIWLQDNPD